MLSVSAFGVFVHLNKFWASVYWGINCLSILHVKFAQDLLGVGWLSNPNVSILFVLQHFSSQKMV